MSIRCDIPELYLPTWPSFHKPQVISKGCHFEFSNYKTSSRYEHQLQIYTYVKLSSKGSTLLPHQGDGETALSH